MSILYGKDSEERIVGVALCRSGDAVNVYTRDKYDRVSQRVEPFIPHMIVTDEVRERFGFVGYDKLKGDGAYRNVATFDNFYDMWKYRRMLKEKDFHWDDYYMQASSTVQYLTQSGKTLFRGMLFDDVVRMQLDIEVRSSTPAFPSADVVGDEVFIIALRTNRGLVKLLHTGTHADGYDSGKFEKYESERELLQGLVKWIHRADPDIIEGHNIFGFDLPYLRDRFKLHDIPFSIGRDVSAPRSWGTSKEFGGKTFEFDNFQIAGRSVIDTMFLAIERDVYTRDFPGYKLEDVARHLNVAAENRVTIPGNEITRVWDESPETVLEYADDDVLECAGIAEALSGATFFMTRMLPMDYQGVHLAGTSGAIEALLVRAYLDRGESLPMRHSEMVTVSGGYTDVFKVGVFNSGNGRYNYADVESLYPSIMLTYKIAPRTDRLGMFQFYLRELTDQRFRIKNQMRGETEPGRREALNAEQTSIKILINSFYGMLGFEFALFRDLPMANEVTSTGRALLRRLIQVIDNLGGSIILCDTDGVLYELPDDVVTDDDVDAYVAKISSMMPEGINIGNDGRFDAVLSYRPKNYILKDTSGKYTTKGVSFRGRNMEPFAARYIEHVALALLDGKVQEIHDYHMNLKSSIISGKWEPSDFIRTASLKKDAKEYSESDGNLVAYELAIRREKEDGVKFKSGGNISYYVSGTEKAYKVKVFRDAKLANEYTKGDENVWYYLDRLKKVSKKWEPFFTPEDFQRVFPVEYTNPDQGSLFGDESVSVANVPILTTVIKNQSEVL